MADQAEKLRKLVAINKQKQQERLSRIVTITSGKGGVGKTTLAVNLGISLAMSGKKTLVMDADLGLSNVNIIAGLVPPPRYNLSDVIDGKKNLTDVIVEHPSGLKLITGAVGVIKLADMAPRQRKSFIKELLLLDEIAEMILIDTSAGLSANVLSFSLAADEVIVITTPQPTALAHAYGIIKAISSRSKDTIIKLIINRIENIIQGKQAADKMVETVGQFLNMRVEPLGYIFEDEVVEKAVYQQWPFILSYPRSKAANCIHHIRNKLLKIEEEEKKKAGFRAILAKLFKLRMEENLNED